MLKEHAKFFRRSTVILDLCVVAAAFYISYALRTKVSSVHTLTVYLGLQPLILSLWGASLYFLGMYNSFRTSTYVQLFSVILKSGVVSFLLLANILFVLKIEGISRLMLASDFALAAGLLALEKIIVVMIFHQIREKGHNTRNILLVGTGPRAQKFMDNIEAHKEWGIRITGLVDDDAGLVGKKVRGLEVIGVLKDIPRIVHSSVIDEIMIVVPESWLKKIELIVLACEIEGVKVHVAMDFYEPQFSRTRFTDLHDFPMMIFESTPHRIGLLLVKRMFDVVAASLLLALSSPVFLLTAVLVRLTSKGPVFFKQIRYGLNGRRFILYKFRTMQQGAHERLSEFKAGNEMQGPAFKIKNDPRVTPLGKFLRKASLDELPQLWNVLKGEMSLIGPRPPIPDEVLRYADWHRRRLRMRPGITCLWQVNGRNNISDFNEWAKLDLEYIDNWSLWLDLKILFKTIPVVMFGIGAK